MLDKIESRNNETVDVGKEGKIELPEIADFSDEIDKLSEIADFGDEDNELLNLSEVADLDNEVGEFSDLSEIADFGDEDGSIDLPEIAELEGDDDFFDLPEVADLEVNDFENVSFVKTDERQMKISDDGAAEKNCPKENGKWDGERGNSKWVPDSDYVPQKKNPEQKTWKEILDKYGIDGIVYKDGEPDFSEISKGDVEIEAFSANRDDNFDKADIELAKQKGCKPKDVEKWRKENGYTWHECKDMKTMQKVPSIVHNNVSHRGGISEAKGGNQ